MANHLSASVQVGQPRLVVEKEEDGRIHYRVEADVQSYWGSIPKQGAIWILQQGIAVDGLASLTERVRTLYGTDQRGPHLYHFEGRAEDYPYQEREAA